MRFHHTIEACDNAEDPTWYVVIAADDLEEYDGTSVDYGREVLENWISDQRSLGEAVQLTDEYGNPLLRVIVRFSDEPDEQDERVAIVGAEALNTAEPNTLAAVDAARDAKLYAKYLDRLADAQLEDALSEARSAGHGANQLAHRVHPAVSRPTALAMMRA